MDWRRKGAERAAEDTGRDGLPGFPSVSGPAPLVSSGNPDCREVHTDSHCTTHKLLVLLRIRAFPRQGQ